MGSLAANDPPQSCPTSHTNGLLTIPAMLSRWLVAACGKHGLGSKVLVIQNIASRKLANTL